jgi:SET domain-containing protein
LYVHGAQTVSRASVNGHHGRLIPRAGFHRMSRRFVARRSPIHGNGVFATAPIGKGEEIIEYKGKLISHDEADDL